MKVVIDCRFLYASGLGRYIREIVWRIIPTQPNWSFHLICRNYDDFKVLAREACNAAPIISNTGLYSIWEQFDLPMKIPVADIFWSPHYPIPVIGHRAKAQIVTILDVNHLVFKDDLSWLQKIYAKTMMFASTRKSDVIMTISDFSKDEIIEHTGVAAGKIKTIYIAVDRSNFKKCNDSPQSINAFKKKYNLPDKYVLFVGNVKPHKNIIGLIKAFQILNKRLPEVQLIVTGRKEKLINGVKGLSSMLSELDLEKVVHFTGFVDEEDLPDLYRLASVFVFPSFYEGFGLPPLEAMSCACPVVVSNSSCFPEICGDAAYFVDPYNSENIADGLYTVLTNESIRIQLISKGFQRVSDFDWDITVAQISQLFIKIKGEL